MTINPVLHNNVSHYNTTTKISSATNIPIAHLPEVFQFTDILQKAGVGNHMPSVPVPSAPVVNQNSNLTSGSPELDAYFDEAGRRYNLNPDLIKAVAQVESNFRPHVTSPVGGGCRAGNPRRTWVFCRGLGVW